MTVAGHEWQLGLVQNISDQPGSFQRGQLLLRPWEERDKRFSGSCEVRRTHWRFPLNVGTGW